MVPTKEFEKVGFLNFLTLLKIEVYLNAKIMNIVRACAEGNKLLICQKSSSFADEYWFKQSLVTLPVIDVSKLFESIGISTDIQNQTSSNREQISKALLKSL